MQGPAIGNALTCAKTACYTRATSRSRSDCFDMDDQSTKQDSVREDDRTDSDQVWTYRGYRLSPSEFNTAMVHFYRGEVSRSNTWRTRLDSTTNWAVLSTGAALSFAFSHPDNPHFMLILNTLLVVLFLYIEARRYRYYELWANRVRLMETDFFAAMLVPPFRPSEDWSRMLAESLLQPTFTITALEATGRRFRRNYFWIFVLLGISWLAKIALHPTPTGDLATMLERAAIGPLSGMAVLLTGVTFNALLFTTGILTAGLQRSTAEVLPDLPAMPGLGLLARLARGLGEMSAEILPGGPLPAEWVRQRDRLAYVITARGQEVGRRLMAQLKHGVTVLQGVGMYTGETRDVLMCAIYPTEVYELKAIVHEVDPNAFVVVNRAEEIMGRRFRPFRERPRWLQRLLHRRTGNTKPPAADIGRQP